MNKNYDSKRVKMLSDEELKNVNGGMKVVAEEKSSWVRTLLDFFFKINK